MMAMKQYFLILTLLLSAFICEATPWQFNYDAGDIQEVVSNGAAGSDSDDATDLLYLPSSLAPLYISGAKAAACFSLFLTTPSATFRANSIRAPPASRF